MSQVLQDLNVGANYTRILKSWSFNYFEEYINTYFLNDCNVISHAGQPNVIKTSTMRNKMAAATETDIKAVAVATLITTVKNTWDDGIACWNKTMKNSNT